MYAIAHLPGLGVESLSCNAAQRQGRGARWASAALLVALVLVLVSCGSHREPEPRAAAAPDTTARTAIAPIDAPPVAAMLERLQWRIQVPAGAADTLPPPIIFGDEYQDIPGVLTFRGNHCRTGGAWGRIPVVTGTLEIVWDTSIPQDTGHWRGTAGWTGQPAIVEWPARIREHSDIAPPFRQRDGFREVIQASLNGCVHFFDLETGSPTRDPIGPGNPVKGSVSVDPRGLPILHVGQGVRRREGMGFRLFNLFDRSLLHFQDCADRFSHRAWGGMDGSALYHRDADVLLAGAENGMLYIVRLNTRVSPDSGSVALAPDVWKYRYRMPGQTKQGIENSVAVYRNLAFFADNGGWLQAFDLLHLRPVWIRSVTDDTDASIVVDAEGGVPMLYTGCEVDAQGDSGVAWIRKMRGTDGALLWEQAWPCRTVRGTRPVNGGLLATPALGRGDTRGLVFFALARQGSLTGGTLLALETTTGAVRWKLALPAYPWSSPTLVVDAAGASYLVQGTSSGAMHLIRASDGRILSTVRLDTNIEASPAVFNDMLVVATRGTHLYGVRIR